MIVTATQGAHLLGIPASTIRAWRKTRGLVPCAIYNDGGVEYRLADLEALAETTRRRRYAPRPGRRDIASGQR